MYNKNGTTTSPLADAKLHLAVSGQNVALMFEYVAVSTLNVILNTDNVLVRLLDSDIPT